MKGSYRPVHVRAMAELIKSFDPPEPFTAPQLEQIIRNSPDPVPRPLWRQIGEKRIRIILSQLERAGFLESKRAKIKSTTRYTIKFYRFKELGDMIIKRQVKRSIISDLMERGTGEIYEPVERVILSDGTRTVHLRVVEAAPPSPNSSPAYVKGSFIPWIKLSVEPVAIYEKGEYKEI